MKVNLPADVIDGDVPQLFVHGGLALLTGVGAEGGLGMFVGYVYLYLTGSFFLEKTKTFLGQHQSSEADWTDLERNVVT